MKINKNFFFLYLILFSFLNNFSFGAIPQSSNIVAYYPFSGDATDSSGNGYDGEITGDPQLTMISPDEWAGPSPYGACLAKVRQLGDLTWDVQHP